MLSRRNSFSLGLVLLTACKSEPASTTSTTTTTNGPLAPSDPIDPAFKGCAHSCGSRSAKDRREARPQPGAQTGDAVFCPVSGAVFRINEKTPSREARGSRFYLCCDSCAAFFSQNEASVLAKRGIS